ncbi:MAG: oligosaccharide flippase family protein [Candidatus Levyibacteriota bacterium]
MKKKIQLAFKHPIISGSIIIFLGATLASFFSFLFNLFMTRNLSVVDYGVLASLLSLTTFFGLVGGAFVPTIVNFAGGYFAKKEYNKAFGLFRKLSFFSFFLGFIIFINFLLFQKQIGSFFNIQEQSLIPLIGLMILLGYMSIVNTAFLQAKLAFSFLSFNSFMSGFLKLLFGIIFIFLGFRVAGALWANTLSGIIPYLVTFLALKFLFSSKVDSAVEIKKVISYGAPAAVSLVSLSSFVTTDIILVKHFFTPELAGIYAGISLIARIIFFFSAPVGTVMFSLIVQKHTRKENYNGDFLLSLFLVLVPSLCLSLIYFIFPQFILSVSTKSEYVKGASMLGIFSIFSTLYALLYLFTNFYLSVKKTMIFLPLAFGAVAQAVLIWFFHSSFFQVILISIGITGLLVIALFLHYFKSYLKQNS